MSNCSKNNTPHQIRHPKEIKFSNVEAQFIDPEINRLLERGVIVPSCHEPGEFTSTIFLRPKPDGSQRLLLNLRFNEHVAHHQFRMESVKSAKQMMKPGCYMPLVHLKDTYYSVHVEKEYQKYLKFYRKSKLHQYTCLGIALLVHSHYSQNCKKPVYSTLRSQGHSSVGSTDDSSVQGNTIKIAI